MPEPLRPLALAAAHRALGARFAPFAGWEMPVQYQGILEEHAAVRTAAGIFDVSHMGRSLVRGERAADGLRRALTFNLRALAPGRAHYALYCTEDGGIADDVMGYRLAADRWLVVHNAANAGADHARLSAACGVAAADISAETGMFAVQGPRAAVLAAGILGDAIRALPARQALEVAWRGQAVIVGRTGYTGEDGVECVIGADGADGLWQAFLDAGVTPCGLGARDTLRLEASLPLHGHDIGPDTHPYEAGLGWAVTLDDGADFIGRAALVRLQTQPPTRRLACLRTRERAVLRDGYAIQAGDSGDNRPLAFLTSGAFSPTLRVGIGMAYLPVEWAAPGTALSVAVRGRALPVDVVRRPFYQRRA